MIFILLYCKIKITMYVINPETGRPIRMGSRVYKSLVQRGVLCPDDMLKSSDDMLPQHPPKLVRSRKIYRELQDIEEDTKEEVKE